MCLPTGNLKIQKSGTARLIRQPLDQNKAAALLGSHLPDQNQAAKSESKSGAA